MFAFLEIVLEILQHLHELVADPGLVVWLCRAPRRNFPAKPSLHRRLQPGCPVRENREILNVREDG